MPRLCNASMLRGERRTSRSRDLRERPLHRAEFLDETESLIPGLRPWMIYDYEHNGLRADGEHVLGNLFDLVRSRA
jgi:hypothetical protein